MQEISLRSYPTTPNERHLRCDYGVPLNLEAFQTAHCTPPSGVTHAVNLHGALGS